MKNIQFTFSVCVALAISVLGALIMHKDPAGFALLAVGTALMLIAFLTKNSQQSLTPSKVLKE